MTGTRVEIELVTSNQEMKVNRPLAEVFYQAMEQTNLPEYTEEELRFAESLTKEAGLVNDGNYFGGLEPLEDQPVLLAIGTDVSEVSHTVPTVMLSAATMCKGTPLHHWSAAAQSGMSIGQKGKSCGLQKASQKKRDWSTIEIILDVWNRWKTILFYWQSEPMSQKSVIPCRL